MEEAIGVDEDRPQSTLEPIRRDVVLHLSYKGNHSRAGHWAGRPSCMGR
jgi:hypothetical protein